MLCSQLLLERKLVIPAAAEKAGTIATQDYWVSSSIWYCLPIRNLIQRNFIVANSAKHENWKSDWLNCMGNNCFKVPQLTQAFEAIPSQVWEFVKTMFFWVRHCYMGVESCQSASKVGTAWWASLIQFKFELNKVLRETYKIFESWKYRKADDLLGRGWHFHVFRSTRSKVQLHKISISCQMKVPYNIIYF